MSKQTLTSVKIDEDLWDNFRIACVKKKFSFQKLSDRAIYLFLTDEEFQKRILNQKNIEMEDNDF